MFLLIAELSHESQWYLCSFIQLGWLNACPFSLALKNRSNNLNRRNKWQDCTYGDIQEIHFVSKVWNPPVKPCRFGDLHARCCAISFGAQGPSMLCSPGEIIHILLQNLLDLLHSLTVLLLAAMEYRWLFLLGSENLYCLVNSRRLKLAEKQHFCSWKTWFLF